MQLDIHPFDHHWLRECSHALVAAEHRHRLPEGMELVPVVPSALAHGAAAMPLLLNLSELDAQRLGDLLDAIDRAGADDEPLLSALLDTPLDEGALYLHLERMQVVRGPLGQRGWLRSHDPRVLIQLPRALGVAIDGLFAPLRRWIAPLNGEWFTLRGADTSTTLRAPALHPVAWAALERIGVVNRALARLGLRGPRDAAHLGAALDRLVQRGQTRHRLESADDAADYACLGHRVHPEFDDHPWVRHLLADADRAADEQPAHPIDILRRVRPEQWHAVRHELQQGQPVP